MLNTWRGLMLAAGVAAIPAFAQAECPPPESLDRYAQTARDALVALDGLVPEEQQRTLENRYTAMSILRWNGQGREAILDEASALDLLSDCIETGRCDAEPNERSGAGPRTIAPQPSDRLVTWANRQLECETATRATETEISPEPVSDPVVSVEQPPEPDVELDTDIEPETAPDSPVQTDAASPEDTEANVAERPPEDLTALETVPVEDSAELPLPAASDEIASNAPAEAEEFPTFAEEDQNRTEADAAAPQGPSLPPVSESETQRFVRLAATAMKTGNLDAGVMYISEICYREAERIDPAPLCELIFDHYDRLAVQADPIAFLAFTDQLCRLDYARGCASLATYFGVTNTADAHLAAINFYDRACNSGDADACAAASDYFITGRASVADPERARDTLYRACDLGRLGSCQDLAEFVVLGVGGDANLERALELNEVACPRSASDHAEVCVAAANFVLVNLESGPERAAWVRTFTERACAIGHDTGCAWHADNLEFGIGGEVDMDGAARARQTACQFGHRASCDARS